MSRSSANDSATFRSIQSPDAVISQIEVSPAGVVTLYFSLTRNVEARAFLEYVRRLKLFMRCANLSDLTKIFSTQHPLVEHTRIEEDGYARIKGDDPLHDVLMSPHSEEVDGQHMHLTSQAPVTPDEVACILQQLETILKLGPETRQKLLKKYKEKIFLMLDARRAKCFAHASPTDRRIFAQFDTNNFDPNAPMLSFPSELIVADYRMHLEIHQRGIQAAREKILEQLCDADFYCRNKGTFNYFFQLCNSSAQSAGAGFAVECVTKMTTHVGLLQEKNARRIVSFCIMMFGLYYAFSFLNLIFNLVLTLLTEGGNKITKGMAQSALLVFALFNSEDWLAMLISIGAADMGRKAAQTMHSYFFPPKKLQQEPVLLTSQQDASYQPKTA